MSLDVKIAESKDTDLSELIEDESPSLENRLNQDLLKEEICEALSKLKPKEKEVLWLYFGLSDGQELSLGAIAKKLKLSRERVRQLRNNALRVLRHKKFRGLRDYLAG